MNLDSASSASSGAPQGSSGRKERGAIALQACDTCRLRKQKCDEQRPKCGLCQRMKLECRYREPQPTKKDKTLVEILDRLKSLEGKVDRIPIRSLPPFGFGQSQVSFSSLPSYSTDGPGSYTASSIRASPRSASGPGGHPYRHATAAHKMLTWPAVQQMLMTLSPSTVPDLQSLESEGSAFIVGLQGKAAPLPQDVSLESREFGGMLTQATRNAGGARCTFPDLPLQEMQRLAASYFDTFNLMYPFMDRQTFLSDIIPKVHTEGFNGDTESTIALLVFALGELANEGIKGSPVGSFRGRDSGIRGGTIERPPGLACFNEARKRMGFALTNCDLENVQIFSLAALYYQSCSRHVEFWRLCVSASNACQVLITCNVIDWSTSKGDLIKRAFWHCAIMETGLHLELDLPLTGIVPLGDGVGLPSFNTPFCEADHRCNEYSYFEHHFASQIALRRLCADVHQNINESMSATETPTASQSEEFVGPTAHALKQLASQLDQWRSLLPRDLQWSAGDPVAFPSQPPRDISQPLDPTFNSGHRTAPRASLFSPDLNSEPVYYPYVYDIQVALLRTRYYYARYMVYRPFVYKALHYPEQMTQEDAQGVAECLKSCLTWPLALSPPSRQKRLVPYLFCWSQNFLGILIIFHMTRHSPILRQIRQQLCGSTFDRDADTSTDLMIDWIRDLKDGDPIAKWCYSIVKVMYSLNND